MNKAKKRGKVWRVQIYDYTDSYGKQHNKSFTASTKAEAEYMAAQYKATKRRRSRSPEAMTVREAVERYIELKALLSPTTIDSYGSCSEYAFQDLMETSVSKLTATSVQLAINQEAKRITSTGKEISPKTVKNEWSLIAAALREICDIEFRVTLPKYQKHIKDYPDPPTVINAIIGTDIELPCLLAIWLSFSMSEVRGIMCADIKDGFVTINQTMVDTRKGAVLKDNAKVETRLRKHRIPPYIMALINNTTTYINFAETGENRPLIAYNRSQIYGRWQTICRHHGLSLSFHDLRHLNASVMNFLNFPTKLAQERGGWKTDYVMKNVYTHTFSKERDYYDGLINDYFEKNITITLPKESEKP